MALYLFYVCWESKFFYEKECLTLNCICSDELYDWFFFLLFFSWEMWNSTGALRVHEKWQFLNKGTSIKNCCFPMSHCTVACILLAKLASLNTMQHLSSPRVTILSASSVRKLVHCETQQSRPPDLKSPSKLSLPFAWITELATDLPSLSRQHMAWQMTPWEYLDSPKMSYSCLLHVRTIIGLKRAPLVKKLVVLNITVAVAKVLLCWQVN